jgi:hypothetical protein
MPSKPRTVIRAIRTTEHLTPTANANPRFRVFFTNGDEVLTQSDASCAYGLDGAEYRDIPLLITLSRAGRITHVSKAGPADLTARIAELESKQQAAIDAGTIEAWDRCSEAEELDWLRETRGFRPDPVVFGAACT